MDAVRHRQVAVNGISMHVAELGSGPPVIMCHGFPHLWYSWRHQLPAVAAAGWRAVAPDMRGYGATDRPDAVADYRVDRVVADVVGLLDELGEERAVFAGFDFGAELVWSVALRAPERVRAAIVINNPFLGRSPVRPSDYFARLAQKHFVHVHYFMEPGVADAELASQPRQFLTRVFWALSGQCDYFETWKAPPGVGYLDALPEAPPLPWSWMTEAEMDAYVEQFTRTGFTGGLNWYRALDLNWEASAPFGEAKVEVPVFFLAGERDCDLAGFSGPDPLGRMSSLLTDLRETVMVPEAGHLVVMERPVEVNAAIGRFLRSLA
ncbi:MAG TPA: alpha/beta hydrolase [Acidimicrobiales bacterium]|nr:alpha/beta hydrolase [Acidimicrobiales bacterium]